MTYSDLLDARRLGKWPGILRPGLASERGMLQIRASISVVGFCLEPPTGSETPRRLDDECEYECPIQSETTALADGKAELLFMLFAWGGPLPGVGLGHVAFPHRACAHVTWDEYRVHYRLAAIRVKLGYARGRSEEAATSPLLRMRRFLLAAPNQNRYARPGPNAGEPDCPISHVPNAASLSRPREAAALPRARTATSPSTRTRPERPR